MAWVGKSFDFTIFDADILCEDMKLHNRKYNRFNQKNLRFHIRMRDVTYIAYAVIYYYYIYDVN